MDNRSEVRDFLTSRRARLTPRDAGLPAFGAHLFDLARTANASQRPRRASPRAHVRPAIQRLLDGMTDLPAYARNGWFDVLAVNRLGAALLPDLTPSAFL